MGGHHIVAWDDLMRGRDEERKLTYAKDMTHH